MQPLGVCGIVAEFNPFHNGHEALIHAARQNGATHVVAVMSGNYVQRASLAVADKRVRAAAALECGCDLVLELPLAHATATARRFAEGAVQILRACGCVDTLCFGSENGDASVLQALAMAVESEAVRHALQPFLQKGMTFARARQHAVAEVLGEGLAAHLSGPNNLLAVEYLYAASRQNWNPRVFTIPRAGAAHDSHSAQGRFASASYLRGQAGNLHALRRYVPEPAFARYLLALRKGLYPADPHALDTAVLAHLRRLSPEQLAELPDLSEGIEFRLHAAIRGAATLRQLEEALKTKRYTLSRVRRLILAAFLGITRADLEAPPPYLRVLGFAQGGQALLSAIKQHAALPLGTSLLRLEALGGYAARAARLEALASDLYALALPAPPPCGWEYSAPGVYLRG